MASNYFQPGDYLDLTAPTGGVVSGNAYLIGALVIIATVTAAATEKFAAATVGVFLVPKATGSAWTECEKIYWDDTAKKFTDVAGANVLAGCAIAAAASGDTTGYVRLNGTVA